MLEEGQRSKRDRVRRRVSKVRLRGARVETTAPSKEAKHVRVCVRCGSRERERGGGERENAKEGKREGERGVCTCLKILTNSHISCPLCIRRKKKFSPIATYLAFSVFAFVDIAVLKSVGSFAVR